MDRYLTRLIWCNVFSRSKYSECTKHQEHLPNIELHPQTVALAATTIPHSKALKYGLLPIDPLNGTHAQYMSQGLKILL